MGSESDCARFKQWMALKRYEEQRNEDPDSLDEEKVEEMNSSQHSITTAPAATPQLQTTSVGPPKKRTRKDKKFEWKDDVVEKLIALWQEQPLLYNVSHPQCHIKEKRRNCINAIVNSLAEDTEVGQVPSVDDVSKKINALRSYFVGERNKIEQSKVSGAGSAEVYRSKWQFYDSLLFLSDNVTPRPTVSNVARRTALAEGVADDVSPASFSAYKIDNKPSSKSSKEMDGAKTNKLLESAIQVLNAPPESQKFPESQMMI